MALPFFVSLLFVLTASKAQDTGSEEKRENGDEEVKKVVKEPDQHPSFEKGSSGMQKFISENLEYPEKAKKDSIEGTVYVRFVVGKEGKVGRIEAVNEAHPELVDAALEVFEGMPDWEPGMKDDQRVPVEVVVPVKFAL